MVVNNTNALKARQSEIEDVEALPTDGITKSNAKQAIERYYDKQLKNNFDNFVNNVKQENK